MAKDAAGRGQLIDELEAVRRRLRETEQRLQLALDAAELGLWEWDLRDDRVLLDKRSAALVGLTQQEGSARTRSWEALIHPDDWPAARAALQELCAGGRPNFAAEYRLRHTSGRWIWVRASGEITARNSAGQPERIGGTHLSLSQSRQTEAALHELAERHHQLQTDIPGMVYAYALRPDGSHAFPYVSPAVRELFGLEPDDVMRDGNRLANLIHPEDRERRDESIRRSARTLQPWRQELRHIVDGQVRWYDCTSRPALQPDGTILWDGIVLDITDRKQAETALRESEAKYRALFDAAGDAAFLLRNDGGELRVVECNDRALEMFGVTREQIREMSAARFWPPQQADGTPSLEAGPAHVVRALEGGVQTFAWRHRRLDGTVFDTDVALTRVLLEAGQHLLAMVRDVSQRTRAEHELRQSEQKYRALSQEFQAILGAIPGSLVLISPDFKIVWANEFAATSLGLTLTDVLGQHCYRCRHNRTTPCEECAVARCFASGKPESGEGETADGRIWELHASPLFGDRGEIQGVIEVGYDVSERRRAAQELKANDAMLRSVFRAAPVGITFNVGRVLVNANDSMCELTGYSQPELLGKDARMLYVTQEEYDDIGPKLYAQLPQHAHTSVETRFRRKDGAIIFVMLTGAMLRPEDPGAGFVVTVQDITKRKRAEEAIRSAAREWQTTFDAVNDIVWMLDDEFRIVRCNAATTRHFHKDINDVLGRHCWEIAHDASRPIADCPVLRMKHSKHRESMELRMGSRWCNINVDPILDEAGNLTGAVHIISDITDRKTTEQALQSRLVAMTRPLDDAAVISFSDLFDLEEIQKIQDAFAESSGTAQLITDPDGEPLTRPSGFCRLCTDFVRKSELGRQRCALSDAALGRVCVDGPTVRPCLSAGLWGAGASIMVGGKHIANWLIGQVRNESLDLDQISQYAREVAADPEEFRRALLEVPVMSEEQFRKVAHTLFVLSRELSTKAYQNVQQARFIADLKRTEEERDRLFNSSIDMLCIAGFDGRFKQVNPAWTRALGWSAEELTRPDWLEFVHPDDMPATLAAGQRLRQGQEVRSFENRYRCKDGTYRWLSWNSYPLPEQQLIFAVSRDITELKAAEAERAKLEIQLRQSQKMEAIGQLAGGVAHDFNNILTAIFGHVELTIADLQAHLPAAQNLLDGMQQIQRSAERASALTRQLLAFSRRQVRRPTVLNLNTTLRDLQKMLHRLITENIDLVISFAPKLPPIEADPGQLEQVIVNLVVNARDAMPEGGRLVLQTGTIVLDNVYVASHADAHPGEHVLLTVSDTGCGMDQHVLEHMFEPFFTTKPRGQGTGLGLSTVYGIIKQAGGHITVYSEHGHGTVFKIHLPSTRKPLAAAPGRSEPPPVGTETILLCEDDVAVRDLAAHVLVDAGYTVLAAGDARHALRMAADHVGSIHLLLTDVIMPDMNGRKLSDALTALRPDTKTLFMSGYTANVIAHHGVLEKNVEFLEKPFSRSGLLRRVRETLDNPAAVPRRPRA